MWERGFVLALLLVFFVSFAGAATIFSDGFESGTLSGWILGRHANCQDANWTASQLDPRTGSWHAYARPTCANSNDPNVNMTANINTSNYGNITFSYYRKLNLGVELHKFRAKWSDGSIWTTVEEVNGSVQDSSYIFKSFNLSSGATNNSNFSIKFECTEGTTTKDCKVDDVLVSGDILVLPDTTPPTVTINSPLNTTYAASNVLFNITLSENGTAYYTINGGVNNFSMSSVDNRNFNATNTSISDGSYRAIFYTNDSNGNRNDSASIYFSIDTTSPGISVISPQNTTYNNATILVNLSSSGAANVWFYNGTGNETYTSAVYRNFAQGSNTLIAYANDSVGNLNSSRVSFEVDSILPEVNIVTPSNGGTFGTNVSLELNFTALDTNLQSCWYSLNEGTNNATLANCANTTFNVSGNGDYTVLVYANDSFGNLGRDNATFSVQIGAPSIVLSSPTNVYLNYTTIQFNYTATDPTLSSCELWGDFNGIFSMNQTNTSVVSGAKSFFYLNLSDGNYKWNIFCNDSAGNGAFDGNQTFYVDTVSPSASISSPSGTYTFSSLPQTISLIFSASDNNSINCFYNVSSSTGTIISNTQIANCAGTTFEIGTPSSYTLHLMVNDSAGNLRTESSNFVVALSSPPAPSGGGGGGGGSSRRENVTAPSQEPNLEIGYFETVFLERGTSTVKKLEVGNTGGKFLNNCKLVFGGDSKDWFGNSQKKGLAIGERYIFELLISPPADAETGDYFADLIVACDEIQKSKNLQVSVYTNKFEVEITNYERIGNKLRVDYNIREFSGEAHVIELGYTLFNVDKLPHYQGSEELRLNPNENLEKFVEFELPKDSFGEFNFVADFDDGETKISAEKKIFLPSRTGITGFLISDANRRVLTWLGVVLIFAILVFAGWRIYRSFRKKIPKMHRHYGKRKFIRLRV